MPIDELSSTEKPGVIHRDAQGNVLSQPLRRRRRKKKKKNLKKKMQGFLMFLMWLIILSVVLYALYLLFNTVDIKKVKKGKQYYSSATELLIKRVVESPYQMQFRESSSGNA